MLLGHTLNLSPVSPPGLRNIISNLISVSNLEIQHVELMVFFFIMTHLWPDFDKNLLQLLASTV